MTNYRRRKKPQRTTQKYYEINFRIKDPNLRIIDETGQNLGVMTLREAVNLANEKEMDLVKIDPKANPPVARIVKFSKFKYQLSKSESSKKSKEKKVKTIRVSVSIGPHDLEVRANKCDEFLEKGHQVKLQVQMKGRQKAHPEVAKEVLIDFLRLIKTAHLYIAEPASMGDSYYATIKASGATKESSDDEEDDEE